VNIVHRWRNICR